MLIRKFAVKVRYLSSKDNKWHSHTTKWYTDSNNAWNVNYNGNLNNNNVDNTDNNGVRPDFLKA